MSDFDVAVMVPTNRPWDFESETSRSIRASIEASGFQVRLIVIENGIEGAGHGHESVPGFGEILRVEYGNKSSALNAGISLLTRETLIVFFDDDVLVPEGIVAAYAAEARRRGPGHYFGGPTKARFEVAPSKAVYRLLPDSAKGLSYGTTMRTGRDFFLGFNWAAFAGDIAAAGGFDPRFGPGSSTGASGQESDAQHRLRAKGGRSVYIPQCLVTHIVPTNRCSEEFVHARAVKNGLKLGYITREDPLGSASLILLRLLRHTIGLLSSAGQPEALKLAIACRMEFWRGFVRGLKNAAESI